MFGIRKEPESAHQESTAPSPIAQRSLATETPRPMTQTASPAHRQPMDRNAHRSSSASNSAAERKLTVGKGLSLAGEISACDILVVEGKVEAKLSDGKLLEITESGQFRGSVEIENADIAGRYDGQLTVHGRLTVRSTGRISGMVKYGELEVNAGGQIIGEMQVAGAGAQASAATPASNNFKGAAKYAALIEEDEAAEATAATRKVVNG